MFYFTCRSVWNKTETELFWVVRVTLVIFHQCWRRMYAADASASACPMLVDSFWYSDTSALCLPAAQSPQSPSTIPNTLSSVVHLSSCTLLIPRHKNQAARPGGGRITIPSANTFIRIITANWLMYITHCTKLTRTCTAARCTHVPKWIVNHKYYCRLQQRLQYFI